MQSKLNGAPLRINGDPVQLRQVLSNLILNGFDATGATKQVDKVVAVETRRNGKFAEIAVTDTGPGVSPEAAKKIFDPFFSTKDHGMGMGLSIVRTILEAHHGQIEVDNRNGAKGAVFRVNYRWLKSVQIVSYDPPSSGEKLKSVSSLLRRKPFLVEAVLWPKGQ